MTAWARWFLVLAGLDVKTSRLSQISLHHCLLFGGCGGDSGLGLGFGDGLHQPLNLRDKMLLLGE
jgi:hypothetical protein